MADEQNFDQVRNLATAINLPDPNMFIGAMLIKGVVTSVGTWTLSANIGGDTSVAIDNIRYFLPYAPVNGDVVQLLKQGSDIVALGKVDNSTDAAARAAATAANLWVTPTLGTGMTSPIDVVKYRKIVDADMPKIQLRGKVAVSGVNTTIFTLPSGFRPTLNTDLLAARDIAGGSCAVQVTISSAGVVALAGVTTGLKDTQYLSGSPRTGTQSSSPTSGVTDVNHTHFSSDGPNPATPSSWTTTINTGFTAHTHIGGDHQHYMDAVDHPTSVSLNGLEFFI